MGKAEAFGTKFNNIIVGISKAAVYGVGAAATAFGTFGTMAVKSYADYEQLTGGVETLFGDSADIVNKYAEGAYKTANLSANQYMETITGFSASLLQGLGGDTEKAAEIGNLAVTDMADNANKMGTGIEAIQNAYQGFAKDNYTMLDNLKLGYGGTAGEMARLVNDSGVLGDAFEATAQNVKDIPFDQLILAIHTVQTEMGITGTTAIEASETISGSWNTLKSSWTNVLTSIASGNKEFLSGSIAALVSSTGDFTKNVTGAVTNVINNVTEALPGLFTAIEPMLPLVFNTLLPAIADGAAKLVTGLAQGIAQNFPMILTTGGEIVRTLLAGIFGESEQLNTAFNGISESFNRVMTAISESGLIQNIVSLLSKIGEKALEIAPSITNIFSDTLVGIINGISNAIGFLVDNFDRVLEIAVPVLAGFMAFQVVDGILKGIAAAQLLLNAAMAANPIGLIVAAVAALTAGIIYLWNTNEGFRNGILNAWETIKTGVKAAVDAVTSVIKGIIDFFKDNWKEVLTFITNPIAGAIAFLYKLNPEFQAWVDGVVEFFKELPGKIAEKFNEIVQGVKDWVNDMVKTVKEFVPNIINSVKEYFEELPGKALEWGKGMIDGFVQGIKDRMSAVGDAVKGVVSKVSDFIGFHSPAKKGEGRYIVEWGSNMIGGFIDGVNKAIPLLESTLNNAVKDFSGDIGVNANFGTTGGYNRGISQAAPIASMNTSAAAGSAAPTVVQHITLSVNVDEIDDIVKLTEVFQSFAHNRVVFGGV